VISHCQWNVSDQGACFDAPNGLVIAFDHGETKWGY